MNRFTSFLFALLMAFVFTPDGMAKAKDFTVGKNTFLIGGKPIVIKAAEIHYPRIPREYWEHRMKMCKALGMNTVCIYIFWNIHEQKEGQFDFTGNNDIAAFCRLAQKNDLYVIVRPGPYVCAEWEMGGLPWWLLKKKDIRLREKDPYFMERVEIFEKKVAEQLAPLAIQNGGPIIMVQVENEYGSYGEDKPYISAIRDIVRKNWNKDLTLFQCDWASNFTKNGLDDLLWTMNFGTGANIDAQFSKLKRMRPDSPLMCSEFWSGWFDKWGARHETRPAKAMTDGIEEMLRKGISFSLYMTHGGTSFGHWAGANSPGFAPDVTSYDYDAPINEYGQATEKYHLLRSVLQRYSDEKLPKLPKAPMPLISFPRVTLSEYAPLQCGIDSIAEGLHTFEEMNMGYGTMIYEVTLPATDKPAVLTMDAHDYAQVFVGGQLVGKLDRTKNEKSLQLPALYAPTKAIIIVEGMGRINFGRAIKDYKGIIGNITLTTENEVCTINYQPRQWKSCTVPDTYEQALKAFRKASAFNPTIGFLRGYFRGYVNIRKVGDTFINMESFGKGLVYVNGHALGRFWNIGPQQTLYLPGCWLKKGRNEIIVLDIAGSNVAPTVFGQAHPELNKLNVKKNRLHDNPKYKFDLSTCQLAAEGQLKPGNGWQRVAFGKPVTGRYLTIEVLSSHQDDGRVAIAELYALDAKGVRLSREVWSAKYADSEDVQEGNNTADKVFDLQESTYWQTSKGASMPHRITIDLGAVQTITGIELLPRAEQGAPYSVKDYRIYIK
ncbi:MAG: beta-galactosidase [Prevotella sp.]|nr:beta-galactosidase [Prevotella sp.]